MNADELPLIENIHAAPRDDGPRLIYAEWLKEHGEVEYSELIRILCAKPCFPLIFGSRLAAACLENGYEWSEFGSKARIDRAIELLQNLSQSERLSNCYFRPSPSRLFRGLPVSHHDLADINGGEYILDPRSSDCPLLRFDFTIRTSYLQDWLNDPLLHYAESVLFMPDFGQREFSFDDIWALANSSLPDRVSEIGIGGDWSSEVHELLATLVLPRLPATGKDRPPSASPPIR